MITIKTKPMNNKISKCILVLITIGTIAVLVNSCKKDVDDTQKARTTAVFNPNKTYGTVKDIDGNIYKTITIGTQTWMAENLRTTHYRNGDAITIITEKVPWNIITEGLYCNYNNTSNLDTIATFGRFYNWYAITDNRNIAPVGWHIPSDEEWTTLTDYLGGETVAGLKLKETGTTHWQGPNTESTNESGFTALPCGTRDFDGSSVDIGNYVNFWSNTEYSTNNIWYRFMHYNNNDFFRHNVDKKVYGLSVRCIKDQ